MIQKWAISTICLISIAACTDGSDYASSSNSRPAPTQLAEIAAPGQDLSRVKLDPSNGCYLYRYRGPIETTYLPVRTRQGNPICTRA
jgi:hypothetical protein